MRLATAALALALCAGQAAAQEQRPPTAAQVRDRGLADVIAWDLTRSLTFEIGARPTGSPQMVNARDWGLATLTRLGFENVHAEPFTVEAWERGPASAEVTATGLQAPRPMRVLALGRSVATPEEGVEGPLVVFGAFEELLAMPAGSLAGAVVLVNQPMTRTQDGSGYSAVGRTRTQGASEAARRGAVAYLVRSLSTDDGPEIHTGAMTYVQGAPRIPAAAISPPDADTLHELAAAGPGAARVRLKLQARTVPNTTAWNVVGEIPGTTAETIVIGGHLDSWDQGTGAVDDAAGIGITVAAAKLVGDLDGEPRRTIRVVLWGAEEMGQSGPAYYDAHAAEVGRLVVASESDGGAGRIWSLNLPPGARNDPRLASLAGTLAPLRIFIAPEPAAGSGADTAAMVAAGVPAFRFRQDMSRYFDWHHSESDTLGKVNQQDVAQNVAAWASLLYLIAYSDIDFRALRPTP